MIPMVVLPSARHICGAERGQTATATWEYAGVVNRVDCQGATSLACAPDIGRPH